MLDDLTQARAISVAAETHPLCRDVIYREVRAETSVAEIVRLMDLDTARYGLPYVLLIRGTEVWPVPITLWKNVRPKDGTRVEIAFPAQEGGAEVAIAAIASAFLPTAAAAGAGALFTAGSTAYALTYAAITVVGALAINALIPPAQQGGSGAGPQNFAITGVGNAANRYGVFPYVIGRHRMFPPLTASGYSETVGRDIYYRGRMTFGWAPDGVVLEDLRIGTTPITEFSGVELEFRNVDKARTLAAMPGLEALVSPKSEESHAPQALLSEVGEQYVYAPSAAAKSVSLTLEPTALYYLSGLTAVVEVEEAGSGTWTAVATYADLASAQTFSAGPFADGISRSWRVRLTAVTEAEVAPKVSRRRSNEGLTVTSASASYQQAEAGWRSGSETMRLYPRDVAEDVYSDVPQQDVPVVKYTRLDTSSVAIDLSFPQGLYKTRSSGKVSGHGTDFQFEYQSTEGGLNEADWIDLGLDNIHAKSTTLFRWTKTITFPEPGEYAIRITRRWLIDEDPGDVNTATLSAIRSFRDGELPSPKGIAEVAFRIKATDQLNGRVDSLNAIVQQLAPVWTGSGWTAPQPVRHPAWGFLQAIRGQHLRRPVRDERIDLEAFRAWATEEPHWTCDYVVDTATQLGEVLDIIAAAGRAKRTLTDLKWSIIRDNAAGPVRQVFTPRNSWGFKAEHRFPRKIHGFRVKARSERLEWQEDEILVLADGFTRKTASELETLDLPGVVVTTEDEDEGNVYRLGRYHLATALNRPATYTLQVGWEHLRVTRGDKVRFVHDVPLIGVGQGRIKAITVGGDGFVDSLVLDDVFDFDRASFRMLVRNVGGNQSFTAFSPVDPQARVWTPATNVAAGDIAVGDLVIVEEMTQESVDLIVTSVRPKPDESAELQLVDAVPAVLDADSGAIPPYSPVITEPRDPATAGLPPAPVVISAYSSSLTQLVLPDLSVRPRIAVQLAPFVTGAAAEGVTLQLRWSDAEAAAPWVYGEKVEVGEYSLLTGALDEGEAYFVEVRAVAASGKASEWVAASSAITASLAPPAPPAISLAVSAATVPDATGAARRPAIRLEWVMPTNRTLRVTWQLRVKATGTVIQAGLFAEASELGVTISEGILPNITYEARASFVTGAPAERSWSPWYEASTDDLRLTVADLADDLSDKIDDAYDRHFQALETVESGTVRELLDAIAASLGPVDPNAPTSLTDEFLADKANLSAQIPRIADAETQIDDAWELMIALGERQFATDQRLVDAGILVDPETGTVSITGLSNLEDQFTEVSIQLNGISGELALRATESYVDQSIAEALIDPSQLPYIDDMQLAITNLEINLSAAEGNITSLAQNLTVNGGIVSMTEVTQRLDAAEGVLVNTVSQTEFNGVEARTTAVEQQLSALPEYAEVTQAVQATRQLTDEIDDGIERNLLELMNRFNGDAVTREANAQAQEQLRAFIDEKDGAVAEQVLTLRSEYEASTAQIFSRSRTQANELSAQAASLASLSASLGSAAARITVIEGAYVTSSGAVSAVEQTISAEYGSLQALATATAFAQATVDGIAQGFVWRLGTSNVMEMVQVEDGTAGGKLTSVRLSSDYIHLDGQVSMADAFITTLIAKDAFISNLEVDTLQIKQGAVVVPSHLQSGEVKALGSGWTTIAQLVLARTSGVRTQIEFGGQMAGVPPFALYGDGASAEFRVVRSGSVFASNLAHTSGFKGARNSYGFTVEDADTSGGTVTYSVQAKNHPHNRHDKTAQIIYPWLRATQYKR